MVFTGVHIDPATHKSVRWRVENSWGPEACTKGFLVMSDDWFTVSAAGPSPPRLVPLR
jgi:bleomycin hydrolase